MHQSLLEKALRTASSWIDETYSGRLCFSMLLIYENKATYMYVRAVCLWPQQPRVVLWLCEDDVLWAVDIVVVSSVYFFTQCVPGEPVFTASFMISAPVPPDRKLKPQPWMVVWATFQKTHKDVCGCPSLWRVLLSVDSSHGWHVDACRVCD